MVKLDEFRTATRRVAKRRATGPIAVAARYDRRRDRIVVSWTPGWSWRSRPTSRRGSNRRRLPT